MDNTRQTSQEDLSTPATLKLLGVELQRDIMFYCIEALCFAGFVFCLIVVSGDGLVIDWADSEWRFYAFGVGMFFFCGFFAEVNRRQEFRRVAAWCYAWRYPIVTSFLILAVVDLIFLRLSDMPSDCTCPDYEGCSNGECDTGCDDDSACPVLDPDDDNIRPVTRSLTAICGILFVVCVLGYWEQMSYTAATNDWITAVLYMSILGWIWLYFARALVPPDSDRANGRNQDNWSWHKEHNENKVLSRIVVLMIVGVVFFVVMGAIVLALFGDAANATGNLGLYANILCYAFLLSSVNCFFFMARATSDTV